MMQSRGIETADGTRSYEQYVDLPVVMMSVKLQCWCRVE